MALPCQVKSFDYLHFFTHPADENAEPEPFSARNEGVFRQVGLADRRGAVYKSAVLTIVVTGSAL